MRFQLAVVQHAGSALLALGGEKARRWASSLIELALRQIEPAADCANSATPMKKRPDMKRSNTSRTGKGQEIIHVQAHGPIDTSI